MSAFAEKLNLKNERGDLKVYVYTVQLGATMVEVAEDVKAVMAYDDPGALDLLRKDYVAGTQISVRQRAKVEVRLILEKVHLPAAVPPLVLVAPAEITEPPKEKTAKDFVYGMMLLAEEFVENPRDKAALKRIISKIEYGNEAISTAEGKT